MDDKKIALITGGATGLGLATATLFVQRNIFTIMVGRNETQLVTVAEKLGPLCTYIVQDLDQLETLPVLVNQLIRQYGQIDILVNNAGIHLKKPMTEVTDAEFQKVILTNLTAV